MWPRRSNKNQCQNQKNIVVSRELSSMKSILLLQLRDPHQWLRGSIPHLSAWQEPMPEPEEHCGEQRIEQHEVNSAAVALRPPLVAPWFYPAPFSMAPSNCCFSWPPFYCAKKQEHHNRKYHGGGRKGRPPKREFNWQGQR
jgi:hypothetical protein